MNILIIIRQKIAKKQVVLSGRLNLDRCSSETVRSRLTNIVIDERIHIATSTGRHVRAIRG